MLESIKTIWHPERYHGFNQDDNFFEGWYYKNVSPDGTSILSIIPGVFKSKDKSKEHAFIQLIDGNTRETHNIKFDISEFESEKDKFEVRIGNCSFSEDRVYLDIEKNNLRVFGEINFKNHKPWHKTKLSPSAMGWYSFIPYMECNHDVLSMNHRTRGKVLINKNIYLFTFGKGYIEKDWGKSFPSSYVWIQSNNFENNNVSFFCSIAKIPWIRNNFIGFICGLTVDDKLHVFATYTGAKIKHLEINDKQVKFTIKDKTFELEVKASKNQGGMLLAPYNNQMIEGRVHETLLSEIQVDLYVSNNKGKNLMFSGTGNFAGLEIVGNTNELIG